MKNLFFKTLKLMTFLFIFTNIFAISASAEEKPPKINAESAILIDADTGDILYSKKGEDKHFPASTTKVLTALVVLENTKLSDVVTVGKNPPFADGSSIGLKEGEKFTVETLLTGLLLESGNDCALALAEHVAGSEENFTRLMNEKAKSIGANNSNFVNASGLPNPKHTSTAHDMALILKEAIKDPNFVRISRLISVELPKSNLDGYKRWCNNHNHLINPNSKYYYKYALAGKSGYTDVSRHTFVISGEKDGRRLVAAFMKAEDKDKNFKDMAKLLDYGFDNFSNVDIYKKGEIVENVKISNDENFPLTVSEDVYDSVPKNEVNKLSKELKYTLPDNFKNKSYLKGEKVTTADLYIDGKKIKTIDLVSAEYRDVDTLDKVKDFSSRNAKTLIISFISLVVISLIIYLLFKKRKQDKFNKKWKHIKNRHNR